MPVPKQKKHISRACWRKRWGDGGDLLHGPRHIFLRFSLRADLILPRTMIDISLHSTFPYSAAISRPSRTESERPRREDQSLYTESKRRRNSTSKHNDEYHKQKCEGPACLPNGRKQEQERTTSKETVQATHVRQNIAVSFRLGKITQTDEAELDRTSDLYPPSPPPLYAFGPLLLMYELE